MRAKSLSAVLSRFHHLTLTAACVCLIVALQPIVPRLTMFLWPLAMLTLLADRLQRRWMLPGWLADLLALVATGLSLGWLMRVWNQLLERPMPVAMVPYLGPLLLVLLVLRLYRSGGGPRDLWLLQAMGLLQIALACALTTDLLFGLLLIVYVLLALPLLALGQVDDARQRAGLAPDTIAPPRFKWRAFRWTAVVVLTALLLFLLTPRLNWQSWDPLRQLGMQSAASRAAANLFSPEMDLGRTGTVNLGTEDAFRVSPILTDKPVALPANQRWRTGVLDTYGNGRWLMRLRGDPFANPPTHELPSLGDNAITLRFFVNPRTSGGLVLAEPILLGSFPTRMPVTYIEPVGLTFFVERTGTLVSTVGSRRDGLFQYNQRTRPGLDRWPLEMAPNTDPAHPERGVPGLYNALCDCPVPQLGPWTRDLLARLAEQRFSGLHPDDLGPVDGPSQQPEKVARALTAYLADSGDFAYTLEIRREDMRIDPVLDFVRNVRRGHCERFAGALALMLRSQGIASRVVRGFVGGRLETESTYVIHQRDAHAWVEALVPARHGPGYDWIALDGTPGRTREEPGPMLPWLVSQATGWYEAVWRDLIVSYSASQQAALWQHWLLSSSNGLILLGIGAAALVTLMMVLLVRWLRRRWRKMAQVHLPRASLPFLQRLWGILVRHKLLDYNPARTPRELAERSALALAARADVADLADLPGRLVELFYQLHFGGQRDDDEVRRAEAELDALARRLCG